MTPQEKAEKLCERYSLLGKQLYSFDTCKECALIAIDEIILHHDSLFDFGLKNGHQTFETPTEIYNNVMNPKKKYWQEVKDEVKKL